MVVQGKRQPKPKPQERKPPTTRISKIASLKKFPDKEYANSILHDVAKVVAPLMHENNFKVGLLCEMYPKSANLLGLNINGGSKIMLRLRYHSNSRSFLPLGDIIGTMLHELTHNLYGPHDQKFYGFLDKLKDRFEQIQYNPSAVAGYVCEENKLGGNSLGGYTSLRDKRVKALGAGKFKAERRRLGGRTGTTNGGTLRLLALEAAERRLQDSKWCNSGQQQEAEPDNDELEIISMDNYIDKGKEKVDKGKRDKEKIDIDKKDKEEAETIIDLTGPEPGPEPEGKTPQARAQGTDIEVVVLD